MARDSMQSEQARKYMRSAHQLLTHYFRASFDAANLDWDDEYDEEIAEVVDYIVKASAAEVIARISQGPAVHAPAQVVEADVVAVTEPTPTE